MLSSRFKHLTGAISFLSPLLLSFQGSAQLPATPPCHIVVLIEENYAYTQIIGSSAAAYAPYLNALCSSPNAAVFTQSFAIEHPSEPNYLDFYSGQNQGTTGSDGIPTGYPFTTPNLGAELLSASKTFVTYSEDLPSPGYDGGTYTVGGANYARKHNPCANWVGTGTNQYSGTVVNLPMVNYFPDSANYDALPTVSYLVPNMTNDMHDGTYPTNITVGDTWFHNHLDSFLNWALANNTLLIITFDEDDDLHNNNIPTIFYGPMVQGGTYSQQITHYSVLRTIEQMYGLGYAGASADSSAITFCWNAAFSDTACARPAGNTGISKVANDASFIVSPNPASGFVDFTGTCAPGTQSTITITDELGRQTGKYTITGAQFRVSTADYVQGIYFYKVTGDNNKLVSQGKFIINHN